MPLTETSNRPKFWLGLAALVAMAMSMSTMQHTQLLAQAPGDGPVADAPDVETSAAGEAATTPQTGDFSLFDLLYKGGGFMIPILGMSVLVVMFSVERCLGLRTSKVMPPDLIEQLGRLGGAAGGFDPRQAYRICQKYPSAASSVIRAMLLKVGRPHSEVEHAVTEASDREAERLYANVRWLNLAAAVTPLLGLLGTVWGMIRAFHGTTKLLPGENKTEYLAEGIYIALITTLGGLIVAIPAAIFAHYLEGRVQKLFHQIDELLFNLLPQVEKYEGRVRFSRQLGDASQTPTNSQIVDDQPVAPNP